MKEFDVEFYKTRNNDYIVFFKDDFFLVCWRRKIGIYEFSTDSNEIQDIEMMNEDEIFLYSTSIDLNIDIYLLLEIQKRMKNMFNIGFFDKILNKTGKYSLHKTEKFFNYD